MAPNPGTHLIYAWHLSEPKRVRWVARNRILTGTCNGRVNLSPLRSNQKLPLETPRGRMAQDANEPRMRNGLWQIVAGCRESIVWCCDVFSGDYLLHSSDIRSTPVLEMKTSQTLRRTRTHYHQTME